MYLLQTKINSGNEFILMNGVQSHWFLKVDLTNLGNKAWKHGGKKKKNLLFKEVFLIINATFAHRTCNELFNLVLGALYGWFLGHITRFSCSYCSNKQSFSLKAVEKMRFGLWKYEIREDKDLYFRVHKYHCNICKFIHCKVCTTAGQENASLCTNILDLSIFLPLSVLGIAQILPK